MMKSSLCFTVFKGSDANKTWVEFFINISKYTYMQLYLSKKLSSSALSVANHFYKQNLSVISHVIVNM